MVKHLFELHCRQLQGKAVILLPDLECPDGGIGRRARLKIWCPQGCAGSIPVLGTNFPISMVGILLCLNSK